MSARHLGPYDSVAYKWLALVTSRQQHLIKLADSGRWKNYYTHDELESELHKTLRLRDQWASIAGILTREQWRNEDAGVVDSSAS